MSQLFSIKRNRLHYLGEPLSRETVDETSEVLRKHQTQRTENGLYRCILFCIASQFMTYERACEFVRKFRSTKGLQRKLREHVGHLRFKNDRFSPMLGFVQDYGIEKFIEDLTTKPFETREEVVRNATWINYKTASFIHLCLGGTTLMALDVHNLRQLGGLEMAVDPIYYLGKVRKTGVTKGQRIYESPTTGDYKRIERETLELFAQLNLPFPEFNSDGHSNGALITTLFWWAGAKAGRNGASHFDYVFR